MRLGLTAHAEAEDIVFSVALRQVRDALAELVREAAEAHRHQELALSALVTTALGSREWFTRAATLLTLVHNHAAYEERHVLPAIRELAPDIYPTLAGQFATERLRQLSMLMPSQPVNLAELARAN